MNVIEIPILEGMLVMDLNNKILFCNESALEMTGFSSHEVKGAYCHDDLLNPVDLEGKQVCLMASPLEEDDVYVERFLYFHHKMGHRILVKSRLFRWEESGVVKGTIETFVMAKGHYTKKALPSNLTEPNTGLANKSYASTYIESSLALERSTNLPFGILILDIDNFEALNMTYGRELGDKVLQIVSMSLKEVFYEADLLVRWSGDEFVLIYANITSNGLKVLGERLRIVMENTSLRGRTFKEVDLTVSVGGTLVRPRDTVDTIVSRAMESVRKSKAKGGNRFAIS